jgi:hypothetical protein
MRSQGTSARQNSRPDLDRGRGGPQLERRAILSEITIKFNYLYSSSHRGPQRGCATIEVDHKQLVKAPTAPGQSRRRKN